jgi:hypothetical protein
MPFLSSVRGSFGATGKSPTRGSASNPAKNAKELVQYGITQDGPYWIQASQGSPAQQVYCILDPAWDGGGWMIITNNAAQDIVYLSTHIPRPTAYIPYVGSNGSNSYSPQFNFSINAQDMQFQEFVFAAYTAPNWKDIYVYYYGKTSAPTQIPTNSPVYTRLFDNWGQTLPFTSAPIFKPVNADQTRNSDLFSVYDGLRGDNSYQANMSYIPAFILGERAQKTNPSFAFPATNNDVNSFGVTGVFSWADRYLTTNTTLIAPPEGSGIQSIRGWDDWQDGNSLADNWGASNEILRYGRGFPAYIMIR